jgi:hypothetical protein
MSDAAIVAPTACVAGLFTMASGHIRAWARGGGARRLGFSTASCAWSIRKALRPGLPARQVAECEVRQARSGARKPNPKPQD